MTFDSTRAHRRVGIAAVVLSAGLAMGGCSASIRTDPARGTSSTTPRTTSGQVAGGNAADDGPHVPGYAFGQIPPVPLFTLPDLAMLDASLSGFGATMSKALASLPGITVTSNHCNAAGQVQSDNAGILLYGDGSGSYNGPDGSVINYGDGSGNYSLNGTQVIVYGDGSGSYTKGSVQIISYGDGSGNYADGTVSLHLYGDGSGGYTRGKEQNTNYGDGSGMWTDGTVLIRNYGDGSGLYDSPTLKITNYGDGTGLINAAPVKLDPIAKVPPLGKFPAMGTIKPVKACAVTVSLPDNVLFDFDKSNLRPEAAAVLAAVAKALNAVKPGAAQVQGHTDSVGTDAYNQGLSERRAASVVAALQPEMTSTTLQPKGFGEKDPVAPNMVGGKDNPAGRQLNRRVDIVIPTGGTQ